jgi:outer membrane protein OmpA-like peptidoglycan-associated protein
MKTKGSAFFWPSFTDLMTSLFFIMLVLFVLSYARLKIKVDDLDKKLRVYNLVEQNLKPLKQDTLLFRYEEEYKRFTLAFDVKFELSKSQIANGELKNFDVTVAKIKSVGIQLQKTIDNLAKNKSENPEMENVSYLLIISGYASQLLSGNQPSDYDLSYQRAYNLWAYWKSIGIDFEANKYKGLVDLQIAGNGWGGVGRFQRDPENFMENETKNQRFIIQIVPKIGNTNSE